jgi:hypothetical protein
MAEAVVWILLILLPNEAAGRQVGPFATQAQCLQAERFYNERRARYNGPQSKCFEAARGIK